MSKIFGDSFGRTFELLKEKWSVVFYPVAGSLAGLISMTPVAAIVILLYFGPIIEQMESLSEDQAALLFIQYLFSPGLLGALLMMIMVLIGVAVQAYLTAAFGGVFRELIRGEQTSLGAYFRNGLKYWPKVFSVQLIGAAVFGVPAILYLKFGVVQ